MGQYRIRHSTAADGETLVSIWRSSVEFTHSFVTPADMAAIDREVQQMLPTIPALLALDDAGRPVGFMALQDGVIESLFVAGDQRGHGAGRALVEHARRESSSLTTVVNEQNHQAVGFYRHMGFTVVGRSPTDEEGRAYPILHLIWEAGSDGAERISGSSVR